MRKSKGVFGRRGKRLVALTMALTVATAPAALGYSGDGFNTDPNIIGTSGRFTIKLIKSTEENSELLRAAATEAARQVSAATGASIAVAPGLYTSSGFDPAPGEIFVKAATDWWGGCAGPDTAGCGGVDDVAGSAPFQVATSGVVWIAPSMIESSHLQNIMLHELGHAVGLAHFNSTYGGVPQVMRWDGGGGAINAYRSGDLNGLRYLADNGFKAAPMGAFESITVHGGGVLASGWAIDQHTASPIDVQLSYAGRTVTVLADDPRPDIDAAHPQYAFSGRGHGFAAFLQVPPGTTASVCATAINYGPGAGNRFLGCRSVAVPGSVYFSDVTGPEPSGVLGLAKVSRADAIAVGTDAINVRKAKETLPLADRTVWSDRAYYGEVVTAFADVTGDGLADAIAVNDDHIGVRASTGSKFADTSTNWSTGLYFGAQGTHFADVDADGRDDLIVVNDSQIVVRLSTGTAFGPKAVWATLSQEDFGDRGIFFADATGDGRADAVSITTNGILVYRAGTGGFGYGERWTEKGFYGNLATAFADVTGDGRADAIAVNSGGITVRTSSGNAFVDPAQWTGAYYGSRGTFFADVDGDARADAIVVNDGKVTVRRSNGATAFSTNEDLTQGAYYGAR